VAAVSSESLEFDGIIGACLTPFDSDGGVDEAALSAQVDFMVPHVDAISIGAVEASEYRLLDPDERRRLIRAAANAVDGRRPTIVGASAPTQRGVVDLAEVAAEANAAAVQVLMPHRPWGAQPQGAELVEWFARLAAVCPLPIVVYHHPLAGADPAPAVLADLSRIDRVVGFKDSSRDFTRVGWLAETIDRAGHARYFTTMQPLLTTLLLGGSGAMMPPPATLIGARIVAAFRQGDLAAAAEAQRVFAGFPGPWARHGLTPLMKRAMLHCGVDVGLAGEPGPELPDDLDEAIAAFVRRDVRPDIAVG
jgi:4-hydroxy-tetrahydrodipicolinate synthase